MVGFQDGQAGKIGLISQPFRMKRWKGSPGRTRIRGIKCPFVFATPVGTADCRNVGRCIPRHISSNAVGKHMTCTTGGCYRQICVDMYTYIPGAVQQTVGGTRWWGHKCQGGSLFNAINLFIPSGLGRRGIFGFPYTTSMNHQNVFGVTRVNLYIV